MEPLTTDISPARAIVLAVIPAAYLLAALLPGQPAASAWRRARLGSTVALVAALVTLAGLVAAGPATWPGLGLRADAVGATVLVLVTFIGWVIVRYSARYLDGEPRQSRYVRALLGTLALVSVVLATDNLLALALAWLGTSLALHQLLTFYGERRPAIIAAHKKFLASRLADLCLFLAVGLLAGTFGTFSISAVVAAAADLPVLSPALVAATVLLVCAALLKCAQLPVHGWLIQVMEAPTPVSALLHAGVVNLGGFLLIRLDALVAEVPAAQALLVVVGGLTAVAAGLVMMTRISIKVMLAWSTCAQMGFMLMQCGLGAYELALLHLVAHSLYKAHAFLAAGGAVEQARLQRMTPPEPAPGWRATLAGSVLALVMVAAAGALAGVDPAAAPALWAFAAIIALALTPLLTVRALRAGGAWSLVLAAGAFAVAAGYFGLHALASAWTGLSLEDQPARPGLVAVVILAFGALFVLQTILRARPGGRLARRLYPWVYAGFYLDELFTRLTFRVWPADLAAPAERQRR